ncbi:GNAT family N-acetyltransferase [Priestia flexa]|uniref:GNAT family N-acetyltransferase n=1 Tax=Priestia flexa TaxID=86664 RepID=UPI001B342AC0|nr:GNAT family protein [Priestia flexa]
MYNEKVIAEKLKGNQICIVPMDKKYIEELCKIGQEKSIWEHLPETLTTRYSMENFINEALIQKERCIEYPFVILSLKTDEVIGTTRFMNISKDNKSLEIGWTWLTSKVWGTGVNIECKYLLLKYCFEYMNLCRVQFKTDERNIRSQKAIEKIGGIREGILRNHMIRKDGSFRNSVFYSIIDSEWPYVRRKLELLLSNKMNIDTR